MNYDYVIVPILLFMCCHIHFSSILVKGDMNILSYYMNTLKGLYDISGCSSFYFISHCWIY